MKTATPTTPEKLFEAFSDPTRLRLLCLIAPGEICVCDLVGSLRLPQPTVSRHLARLRRVGLVHARRSGLWMWYSLAPARGAVHAKLLECLASCASEMPDAEKDAARACKLRASAEGRCC